MTFPSDTAGAWTSSDERATKHSGTPASLHELPAWNLYSPRQRRAFLAILFLVSTSNFVDRQVMSVLLEPIKHEFGASDVQMGLLGGFAFAACYAVCGLPVAWLADRGDRKVVITLSLAAWSVMTMLCGLAASFPLLLAARMGVGIGEAGAIPPAQSLIADYFPPEQRTRALSIFMTSATVGSLIAFVGAAQLASGHGWRTAFIALGAPGLLLCLLTRFGLREPRLLPGRAAGPASFEGVTEALETLARRRSFVLLCTSMVLYYLVAYGVLTWFPAYMVRVLGLSLVDVGASFGLVSAVSAMIGTLGGGWLMDRLAVRDLRWLGWLPGALLIATWPCYTVAILTDDYALFLLLSFVAGVMLGAAVPAMFTVLHRICGSARRAMAVAVCLFLANLLGLGLGPLMTGALSDMFSATMGPIGLRPALAVAVAILLPSGALLLLMARSIPHDTEA